MKSIITLLLLLSLAGLSRAQQPQSLPEQYQKTMEKIFDRIPAVAGNPASKLLDFARSMLGVPYRYASSNPARGFDCSGFVSYVFGNFGFDVPRSSSAFAAAGKPVKLEQAKVGDLLIFTGTNRKVRRPGHVGIIYAIEDGQIRFIHASSGKAKGVTITPLDGYYKSRFLKAVSIIE